MLIFFFTNYIKLPFRASNSGKMSNQNTVRILAESILSAATASSNNFCHVLKIVWKNFVIFVAIIKKK